MPISASQHISAVLTAKESPRGQAGYQVLLSTSGRVSKDEIQIIEARVRYGSAQDEKAKWQFYRLPTSRPVISHIIPIPQPDEFGRRGRYLAHSLIFNAADCQRVDRGLFDLLQPKNFFTSVDQALAFIGLKEHHIAEATLEGDMEWTAEAIGLLRGWSGDQLHRLVHIVNNHQLLAKQERYVAMIGNEIQVLDALKIVFLLAPPSARKHCSFDTNAVGCEWHGDAAFWARGFSGARQAGTTVVIDAAERRVTMPESLLLRPSAYGQWIEAEATAKQYRRLGDNLSQAQTLAALLEGKTTNARLLRNLEPGFERCFADANASLVKARTQGLFPRELSGPLREAMIASLSEPPVDLLRWLIDSQYAVYIREPVYQALLRDPDVPLTRTDLQILDSFAKTHHGIGLMLALKADNHRRRLQLLAGMSPHEYRQRVRELMTCRSFQPWQGLSPAYIDAWFALCKGAYTMDDIFRAMSVIEDYGSKRDRQQVSALADHLNSEECHELLAWVASSSSCLPSLRTALERIVRSRKDKGPSRKPDSFWRRFKTRP